MICANKQDVQNLLGLISYLFSFKLLDYYYHQNLMITLACWNNVVKVRQTLTLTLFCLNWFLKLNCSKCTMFYLSSSLNENQEVLHTTKPNLPLEIILTRTAIKNLFFQKISSWYVCFQWVWENKIIHSL